MKKQHQVFQQSESELKESHKFKFTLHSVVTLSAVLIGVGAVNTVVNVFYQAPTSVSAATINSGSTISVNGHGITLTYDQVKALWASQSASPNPFLYMSNYFMSQNMIDSAVDTHGQNLMQNVSVLAYSVLGNSDGTVFPYWLLSSNITVTFEIKDFNGHQSTITLPIHVVDVTPPAIIQYSTRFISNGGTVIPTQQVDEGTLLTKPLAPVRTGYTFGGWYTDQALTQAYDFSTPVTANLNLYAKWNINVTSIISTAYTDEWGNNIKALVSNPSPDYTNTSGETLTYAPPIPSIAGYTFKEVIGAVPSDSYPGMYIATFGNANKTVIFVYTKNVSPLYSVNFVTNSSSTLSSQTVEAGGTLKPITQPIKPGYTFVGWYSDTALTQAVDLSSPINHNLTVYGKWSKNPDLPAVPGTNNKPIISGATKILQVGDKWLPMDNLESVYDDEDGYITNKAVMVSNNVNTSKAGTYHVTYGVTDSAGNDVTATFEIKVYDVSSQFPSVTQSKGMASKEQSVSQTNLVRSHPSHVPPHSSQRKEKTSVSGTKQLPKTGEEAEGSLEITGALTLLGTSFFIFRRKH